MVDNMEKAEETLESTAKIDTVDEQKNVEEEERQQRIVNCTSDVQKALTIYKCDLDVTVLLKAGQVIPRIGIVPLEVLQAQRAPQKPPM